MSIALTQKRNLQYIFFGHYGASKNPKEVYKQVRDWLQVYLEEAEAAFSRQDTLQIQIQQAEKGLRKRVFEFLDSKGIPSNHPAMQIVSLDLSVCAMGLIDYLEKRKAPA